MYKVAFFADILSKDFDGASRTMYQLISRIDQSKFNYNFITGHNNLSEKESKHLKILETPSLSIPFQKRYKMSFPYRNGKMMKKYLNDFAPDVIHISTPSLLGLWALRYAKKRGIPVISIFHTYFSSYLKYYFKRLPFIGRLLRYFTDWYQQWFYNRCATIYVPSNSMKEELISIGVQNNRIEIWERGIDHELFNPKHADLNYINNLTRNKKQNILFVSRLVWEKNLNALIALYKELSKQALPYNLIVAGSGHAEVKLKKEMPNAFFLGSLNHSELSKLYASADLLFFPSISETFGNVVLEGLSSGLPALVANKGGTKDMIQHGHNGFICGENDISCFMKFIVDILENKQTHQDMKTNAVNSSKRYNWTNLSAKYFDEIVSLAGR